MANHTFLDAVNELLIRVNEIAGDAGRLTTFTDSARQHIIDVAKQVINEGVDELYSTSEIPLPTEQKEGTLTLVTATREYTLATDLVQLRYPLIDRTNSQFIYEYAGSYDDMLRLDIEQDDTGLPHSGKISPVNAKLHLDRAPTSVENGRAYTYQYDRDLVMSATTDFVPFGNACFRAMVPVWAQLYKREIRNEFDAPLYKINIGRAAQFATTVEPRTSWSPRG